MRTAAVSHFLGATARRLASAALVGALFIGALAGAAVAQDIDADDDGIYDADERIYQTDPLNPDTDGDGLTDGYEVYEFGSSPGLVDTDNDLLLDNHEAGLGTAQRNPDTDGDSLWDGQEVGNGTDPKTPNQLPAPAPAPGPGARPDSDADGLYDDDETDVYGTDPGVHDSDGDGSGDGEEVYLGADPLQPTPR